MHVFGRWEAAGVRTDSNQEPSCCEATMQPDCVVVLGIVLWLFSVLFCKIFPLDCFVEFYFLCTWFKLLITLTFFLSPRHSQSIYTPSLLFHVNFSSLMGIPCVSQCSLFLDLSKSSRSSASCASSLQVVLYLGVLLYSPWQFVETCRIVLVIYLRTFLKIWILNCRFYIF